MHKIVLYEFTCSGELWRHVDDTISVDSLVREGRAMLTALAADFAAIGVVQPIVMRDGRRTDWSPGGCQICDVRSAADEESLLRELSREAAGTILIAPEFDGLLLERCRWVEESGGRLLGPSCEVVAIAGDKQRTAEHLAAHGVPAPRGMVLRRGEALPHEFRYPTVIKPVDGCGSQEVKLISQRPSDGVSGVQTASAMRLEEFMPGMAASVAMLCGPNELRPLAPCYQRLSADGRFQYLGGSLPLPAELAKRAQNLAVRAVATLPQPRGYIGVDLVLGDDPSGLGDAVIEINPRLTTSYIGLRAAAKSNLAEAMWAIAQGREAAVSFGSEGVEFDSNGTVKKQLR